MNCDVPKTEVCFTVGVDDAITWGIPDATVDPLGYDFKLGDYTFTATDGNGATQNGTGVIVTIPILAVDHTEPTTKYGHIVSNTKEAGKYEAIKVKAEFVKPIDDE